jgi:hypothetical protein
MLIITKQYKKDANPRLTEKQRAEYAQLKKDIQREIYEGLKHFEQAGRYLLIVRDQRLYREDHASFSDFVRSELGESRRFADYLCNACTLMEDLRSQGVVQLPDSERICRELSKFPKVDRVAILKRAQAISNRKNPTYLQIREAATSTTIVPSREMQKVWIGQLLQRFRDAKRMISVNTDFTDVTEPSMVEVVKLLVEIEQRVREISVQADKRVEHFLRGRVVNKRE